MAVEQRRAPLAAYCTATVNGVGTVDVETDYLPHVIQCENGSAPLEALKAQAVAARTYLYYKLDTSGSINDGTSDQVFSCGANPLPQHIQAVQDTAGEVLTYSGVTICAFYVAGGIPSASDCVWSPGDSDPTSTEHYVTYNWGLSGGGIEQTSLGWVSPSNTYNRGCKSQNGASCLADQGWGYQDILKFYYGMDIGFEQATGSCVAPPTECTAGEQQTRDCTLCGLETRTCDSSGSWGAWGPCEQQGDCEPGAEEQQACGDCGLRHRVCSSQCLWQAWGDCLSEDVSGPCDTGELGRCAEGQRRCVDGQLVCEPLYQAELERCDDLDNDCNGEVDEGLPPVLGEPPPALAAQLDVLTAPSQLEPGAQAVVELQVTNVGSQDWAAGAVQLRALDEGGGGASALYVEGGWESPEVVLTLGDGLPASQQTTLRFLVTLGSDVTEPRTETFWLCTAEGTPLPCPGPAVTLELTPDGTVAPSRPDAGPNVEPPERMVSGCGCRTGVPPGPGFAAGLWLLWWLRRRGASRGGGATP